MSQPSIASYFGTRKRAATEDLKSRAKVLILDQEARDQVSNSEQFSQDAGTEISGQPLTPSPEESNLKQIKKIVYTTSQDLGCKTTPAEESRTILRANRVVRNIQFDSPKSNVQKSTKMNTRARATRSRKLSAQEGQADIRETFLKLSGESSGLESKNVVFEKKGALSPKKKGPSTPRKNPGTPQKEEPAASSETPKKSSTMEKLARQELSLGDIKKRINKSSRLDELKARIASLNKGMAKLDQLNSEKDVKQPQIQKFERIEMEVPASPQKALLSPRKNFMSPVKNIELPKHASPQRRLLFAPKESPASPVKSSPTKMPAYQRYQSLVESGTPALPLPYNYRLLAEAFRCVDTVVSMLFNRKETITFKKLKPAVQQMLHRNFNIEHLAQIKSVYPNAFIFNQEKLHNFGSTSKQDKYELVLVPTVEPKNGLDIPDADNVLKSGSETSMCPTVLLERRRIFYNSLLGMVKDQHDKFLLSLEPPMVVPKEKITRWHPAFDVENCDDIAQADLPQPPNAEKFSTAKDVLDKAKAMFNCNTRMEKALQRLADAKMTSKTSSPTPTMDVGTQAAGDGELRKVDISIVDTPPATPTTNSSFLNTAFKGIPKALLEKVRAKQAAKALEAMTRSATADKEATQYSRLPEMAKIIRNIFVAEKKGVLTLEFVIKKLDNSYRAKLTPNELEEHVRLLCRLLPTWTSVHNVRNIDYMKLARDVDLNKVVRRLEIMANDKVKG